MKHDYREVPRLCRGLYTVSQVCARVRGLDNRTARSLIDRFGIGSGIRHRDGVRYYTREDIAALRAALRICRTEPRRWLWKSELVKWRLRRELRKMYPKRSNLASVLERVLVTGIRLGETLKDLSTDERFVKPRNISQPETPVGEGNDANGIVRLAFQKTRSFTA